MVLLNRRRSSLDRPNRGNRCNLRNAFDDDRQRENVCGKLGLATELLICGIVRYIDLARIPEYESSHAVGLLTHRSSPVAA